MPGGLDKPGAGELGEARSRPLINGRRKSFLCDFLGEIKVADLSDQRGDDPAPV